MKGDCGHELAVAKDIRVDKKVKPTLMFDIGGYKVDQVSLFVQDMRESLRHWEKLGHREWVQDVVLARETMRDEYFRVHLAFNYSILPNKVEFELIQVEKGTTFQIPDSDHLRGRIRSGLSHFGFHVDDMKKAVHEFAQRGYFKAADVMTLDHSSSSRRYHYTFINTQALGFITKLIVRVGD